MIKMTKPKVTEKQILVVEDEPAVAMSTRMFLTLDGHSVDIATDGVKGLERFQKSRFDLVITDYRMPGMSGDQLAANIKRLAPTQPVLMLSAYVEDLGGRPPGVDAMLSKPFSLQGLREAIADLLETPKPEG